MDNEKEGKKREIKQQHKFPHRYRFIILKH